MRRGDTSVGKSSQHAQGAPSGYFTYTDANGVQVIVEHLADVPAEYRAQVKAIDLSQPAINVPRIESSPPAAAPAGSLCLGGAAGCLHTTSFLVGAVVALVLGGTGMLLFRRSARIVGLVAGILVVAALTTALLTHTRRQAGLPGQGLVTPGVLLDDARAAAKAVEDRYREQASTVEQLGQQR